MVAYYNHEITSINRLFLFVHYLNLVSVNFVMANKLQTQRHESDMLRELVEG